MFFDSDSKKDNSATMQALRLLSEIMQLSEIIAKVPMVDWRGHCFGYQTMFGMVYSNFVEKISDLSVLELLACATSKDMLSHDSKNAKEFWASVEKLKSQHSAEELNESYKFDASIADFKAAQDQLNPLMAKSSGLFHQYTELLEKSVDKKSDDKAMHTVASFHQLVVDMYKYKKLIDQIATCIHVYYKDNKGALPDHQFPALVKLAKELKEMLLERFNNKEPLLLNSRGKFVTLEDYLLKDKECLKTYLPSEAIFEYINKIINPSANNQIRIDHKH